MTARKMWKFNDGEFVLKVPAGKSERSIVCHVGSSTTGLLDGCLVMFCGSKSKKSDDYHTEMNRHVFPDWLKTKVFPALKSHGRKSVLVLDRAEYHTPLTESTKPPGKTGARPNLSKL